ncbi:MAG: hypothetical protein JKY04_06005 [Sneathiella sp.]|nr:hypothetical protein [Sneathiella sp.]
MKQIPMDFAYRSALGREDFLVSAPNENAVAWIDRWPEWPGPFLLVTGPEGCGKTHLSQVWANKCGAVSIDQEDLSELDINALNQLSARPLVLENITPGLNEQKLFHLYNMVRENDSFLMMTSCLSVVGWDLELLDLKSRMGAVQIAAIEEPDDVLFASILLKLFSDRQLQITPEIIQYLVTRLERSFKAAVDVVSELDGLSLAEKRKITIPLVRTLFENKEKQHGLWD